MVLPASDRVSRAPPYSRTTSGVQRDSHTGLSPAMVRLSSRLLLPFGFVTPASRFGSRTAVVQPRQRNARSLTRCRFRLFPVRSPLLRESRLMSVPLATEMFQFTRFALPTLYIQVRVTLAGRVSPFGHLRIKACLPAPRSFSQATTSFIACDRQGIHHMHLFA